MALKIFLQNIFDFTLKDPKAPERSGGAFGEWGFGVLGMGQPHIGLSRSHICQLEDSAQNRRFFISY